MTTHNLGLPMSLFLVIHSVVAGDFLTGFTMMPRSFTGDYCGPIATAFHA